MLGKIFGIICIVSFTFGVFLGNGEALGNAVMDGAAEAVRLTVSLVGIMGLWCGLMRVAERVGIMRGIAKLLSPILRIFFPDAVKKGNGDSEIAASIAANLLGMGNAATPFALSAMRKLKENGGGRDEATPEMITLAVLNTASFSLVPTTLLALRRAAGSTDPYAVILPVWIVSFACSLTALVLTKLFGRRKARAENTRPVKARRDKDAY